MNRTWTVYGARNRRDPVQPITTYIGKPGDALREINARLYDEGWVRIVAKPGAIHDPGAAWVKRVRPAQR